MKKGFGKNIKQIMNGKILMLCVDEVLTHLKLMVNVLCSNYFGKHSSCIVIHSHLNLIYFFS